jgi:DNA-binding transcriptional MerR regulator
MRIGELAAQAEVNLQTIRFYERRRILDAPPRTAGGYRIYSARDLENLIFIRQSQELGFSLKEIARLLRMHRTVAAEPSPPESRFREQRQMSQFARARLEEVEHKLVALKRMRRQLLTLIDKLETSTTVRCPGREMRDTSAVVRRGTAKAGR